MILDIVFAAGCFWGVEKHFENIDGVIDAVSGYAGGNYENPNYDQVLSYRNMQSKDFYEFLKTLGFADETLKEKAKDIVNHTEAVKVTYDSTKVSSEKLIKSFWEIHDPTQKNRQGNDVGNNYRSALFWTNDKQKSIAHKTKSDFQALLTANGYGKIVTEIQKLDKFWPAENHHQDYLVKNPNGYCPDHSTGIKFVPVKDNELLAQSTNQTNEIITPLGGKEVLVVNSEDINTCFFCLHFKADVVSKYQGSTPLRSATKSTIKDFDIDEVIATPTIFFIENGKQVSKHEGSLKPIQFYEQLGKFKFGESSEEYNVAFNKGTDPRFCQKYDLFKNTGEGQFVDALSGQPLFDTKYRFNSGTGWLSFTQPVNEQVYEKPDYSYGMNRIEIKSKSSDIHLGHVFNDGPDGKSRYCINATVLEFRPAKDS